MSNKIRERSQTDSRKDLVKGTIRSVSDLFSFFIPDDKSTGDLYIHSKNLNGATDKDVVYAKQQIFKGRKEGIVCEVVSKGMTEIIGVVDIYKGKIYLIPFSRSFKGVVMLTSTPKYLNDNDVVSAKIHTYPNRKSDIFTADIIGRLGSVDDVGIDNKIVVHKYSLSSDVPDSINAELSDLAEPSFDKKEKGLTDFRKLYTATIDGATAKDFDDAITIETSKSGYTLYVHIADVSRYVKIGSDLDDYAKSRGTSIYFPQFAIPMLPEKLSNNLCSLLPDADRYTVTAKIEYDKNGVVKSRKFYRSMIRSDARLTYDFVNQIIADESVTKDTKLKTFVKDLKALYDIIDKKKHLEDHISFDLPEAIFSFDDTGAIADIKHSDRGVAERAIEYFMIAANEAVAEYLSTSGAAAVYRIHDKPDPQKVDAWVEAAKALHLDVPHTEEIDRKLIADYSNMAIASKYPEILLSLLVRSMMRAEYSTDNIGHFGLGLEYYAHFTSPIRRYPDLLVHRALIHKLFPDEKSEDITELDLLAKDLTALERLAFEAESDICQFKKLEYLSRNSDRTFNCYISKISQFGLSVYIDSILFPATVEFKDIEYDSFVVENGVALGRRYNKRFKSGDRLQIKLLSIDIAAMQARFYLADDASYQSVKSENKKVEKKDHSAKTDKTISRNSGNKPAEKNGKTAEKKNADLPKKTGSFKKRKRS